jgi:hypothetical protein
MFRRQSLVLDVDCLIKLEHEWLEWSKNRVRKVMFDRVEQIVVWRVVPWVRVLVVALVFGLPGLLLMLLTDIPGLTVLGAALILVALVVDAWFLYCRKTTIRIIRAGKTEDITSISRPARVQRLVQAMVRNIHTVQAVAAAPTLPAEPPVEEPAPPPALDGPPATEPPASLPA